MNKLRAILILGVIVALLIPTTALAAGTFYCSSLITTGGDGSYANPWACPTQQEIDLIIYDNICALNQAGHLYVILPTSYLYFQITWIGPGPRDCEITFQSEYPGYPPDTGVDLPMPMLLGGAVLVGSMMLGVGLILKRRSRWEVEAN